MIHPQVHLRIPCYDFSFLQIIRFKCFLNTNKFVFIHHFHRIIQSVGATGGVYKGQGRNQRKLMTCAYQEFLVQDQQFQWSIPSLMNIQKIPHCFRKRFLHVKRVITRCVHHCSARAAQSIEGHHRPVIASNFHLLVNKT